MAKVLQEVKAGPESEAAFVPAAEHWECTIAEYHAAPGLSNSQISEFIEDPALYRGRRDGRFEREPKACFDLGHAAHALAEGQPTPWVTIPDTVLSKSGAKSGKAWEQFEAAYPGQVLLKTHEADIIYAMADGIAANETARRLLQMPGLHEHSIRWHDDARGIELRCRPDRLVHNHILDRKTAASVNPKAWLASALKFGYHRQAAFYQSGVYELTGERLKFFFLVTCTKPPYGCEVFELDEELLQMGAAEIQDALDWYVRCRATGIWERPGHGEVIRLSAPQWMRYAGLWRLEDEEETSE